MTEQDILAKFRNAAEKVKEKKAEQEKLCEKFRYAIRRMREKANTQSNSES